MIEYGNPAKKKVKLSENKTSDEMADENMEVDKKPNFSAVPANGSMVRGSSSSNAKGDVKKLVIKNFKCKFLH
jgi:hypothetical protein